MIAYGLGAGIGFWQGSGSGVLAGFVKNTG